MPSFTLNITLRDGSTAPLPVGLAPHRVALLRPPCFHLSAVPVPTLHMCTHSHLAFVAFTLDIAPHTHAAHSTPSAAEWPCSDPRVFISFAHPPTQPHFHPRTRTRTRTRTHLVAMAFALDTVPRTHAAPRSCPLDTISRSSTAQSRRGVRRSTAVTGSRGWCSSSRSSRR